jgi:hypothetical protein
VNTKKEKLASNGVSERAALIQDFLLRQVCGG